MRIFGLPLKRAHQFVPQGLDVPAPSQLIRSGLLDHDASAGLPVVYACLQLLTGRLTAMPIRVLDVLDREMDVPSWLTAPSPSITGADLVSQIAVSLVQHGNAYLLPVRDAARNVGEVMCVAPEAVAVSTRLADGSVEYRIAGHVYDGELHHVRYIALPGRVMGLSAWDAARRSLETGLASQDFIRRHFDQSAHLQMALISRAPITGEQKSDLRTQLRQHHVGDAEKAWAPVVLDGDVDLKPLSMTAEQAQFVELAQMSDARIASQIFRIDPSLVGISQSGSSLTYSNLVDREAQLYRDAIRPLAVRIEAALTALLPFEQRVDLDAREQLRGSPRDRADLATKMKAMGVFTADELRQVLGYTPLGDDDVCVAANPPNIVIGEPTGMPEPSADASLESPS